MKSLITTISGAIIGYITNWLAIKMLFRPYEEKKILGFKVPFTPGLIPKEKNRIAKSVGEAIGNHLLTKETMVESLCSEKINKKLENWVYDKVESLKDSEKTLAEIMEEFSGEQLSKVSDHLNKSFTEYLNNAIKSEKTKEVLCNYIEEYIEKNLDENPRILVESSIYNNLSEKLSEVILNSKNENEIKGKLNYALISEFNNLENSDRKIKDIIPESTTNNLKVYIYNKKEDICNYIKEMLNSEKAEIKIKDAIGYGIGKNVNPMIAMFLNKDSLYEKAMVILNDFMDKEDSKQEIIMFLGKTLDKILDKEVGDILRNSSEAGREDTTKALGDLILDKFITEKNIKNLQVLLKDKIYSNTSLRDIVTKLNKGYKEDLNKFIYKKIEEVINKEEFYGKIQHIVKYSINSIFNKSLKDIFNGKENAISHYFYTIVKNLYNRFIENEAESVIEALDIASITEEKINSFDVAFAEQIILEIASKELSAITWLGALLGGIMGLVSFFISSI